MRIIPLDELVLRYVTGFRFLGDKHSAPYLLTARGAVLLGSQRPGHSGLLVYHCSSTLGLALY